MEHRGYILSGSSDGAGRPMTESFYEAFINCRHRVLGRNLKTVFAQALPVFGGDRFPVYGRN